MSNSEPFNDLKYQRKKLIEVLLLIQNHASDGSAFQNCKCIQEKHLNELHAYASETAPIAENQTEKQFYQHLALWSDSTLTHVLQVLDSNNDSKEKAMWLQLAGDTRNIRREITKETWQDQFTIEKDIKHELSSETEQEEEHVLA